MVSLRELQADLNRVYEGIQHLQVQPTKVNVAIILDALQTLEKCDDFLKEVHDGNADSE